MRIKEVKENKNKYMNLLLIADESENMIQKYIKRGRMYVLEDSGVKTVCIITDEDEITIEIKNIVTVSSSRKMGYAKMMIRYIENLYKDRYKKIKVGTGDSPLTIPFYKKCGFSEEYRVKDFFIKNYDHIIIECGVQLRDMVYLSKKI